MEYSRYKDSDLVYDIANMKQETIVNRGKQSHCGIYSSLSCDLGKHKHCNGCALCIVPHDFVFPGCLHPKLYHNCFSSAVTVGLKDLVTSAFVNKHNNHSRATLSKL